MTEELSKRTSRLFGEQPWKHDNTDYPNLDCAKCGAKATYGIDSLHKRDDNCPVPDLIDINDLGKALECFRGLIKGMYFSDLKTLAEDIIGIPWNETKRCATRRLQVLVMGYVGFKTAPQIYEICCLAVENNQQLGGTN